MTLVFKTKEGSPAVEVVGVGYLGPDGKGGLPVDEAAERGHAALLERDEKGLIKIDEKTGTSIPLKGKKLENAARDWAERHDVEVVTFKGDPSELPLELGVAPDRPSARDVSIAEYEANYSGLEPVNTDGDEMVAGGPLAGAVRVPNREEPSEAEQRVEEEIEATAELADERREG